MLLGNSYTPSYSVSLCSSSTFTTLSGNPSLFPQKLICSEEQALPRNYFLETRKTHKLFVTSSSSSSSKVGSSSSNREEEAEVEVVTAVKSSYNDILIVDTPASRLLLLDSTCKFLFFYYIYSSMFIHLFLVFVFVSYKVNSDKDRLNDFLNVLYSHRTNPKLVYWICRMSCSSIAKFVMNLFLLVNDYRLNVV